MIALLSLSFDTWQSAHVFVSPLCRTNDGWPCGRRSTADRVRHVRAERDAAHAVGRDRLLLHVDRLAVVVVRPDVDRAARPRRADAVARHVAVVGQHVDVVAQRLEVVRGEIPRHVPLVVQRSAPSCSPSAAGGSQSSLGSTTSGRRCSSSACSSEHTGSLAVGLAPFDLRRRPPNRTVFAMCERTL